LKFTRRNGQVTIECQLIKEQGCKDVIKVSVKDTGVGIKTEDLPKLFRLFGFLTSSQKLNTKGIGLGLFICKKISQVFGGDV